MAIVNVWYPKILSKEQIRSDGGVDKSSTKGFVGSVLNIGHASLELDQGKGRDYLSWWPNQSHSGYFTPDFGWDIRKEGRIPSVRVRLNCLDEVSIQSWWRRVKLDGGAIPYKADYHPADVKWTLDRNNCSHMVWLALKVGGSEQFAEMLRFGMQLITPQQIHLYATRLLIASTNNAP